MSIGAEKVNAVKYLTKPPPPVDKYYYEEDNYVVNDKMGVFNQTSKDPIKRIGTKVVTLVTTTKRVNMSEM